MILKLIYSEYPGNHNSGFLSLIFFFGLSLRNDY
jgi:hypothetical protein